MVESLREQLKEAKLQNQAFSEEAEIQNREARERYERLEKERDALKLRTRQVEERWAHEMQRQKEEKEMGKGKKNQKNEKVKNKGAAADAEESKKISNPEESKKLKGAATETDDSDSKKTETSKKQELTTKEMIEKSKKDKLEQKAALKGQVYHFRHEDNGDKIRREKDGSEMSIDKQNWQKIQGQMVRTNQAPQEAEESKDLQTKLFCKPCNIGFKSKNKFTAHRKTQEHRKLASEYQIVSANISIENTLTP